MSEWSSVSGLCVCVGEDEGKGRTTKTAVPGRGVRSQTATWPACWRYRTWPSIAASCACRHTMPTCNTRVSK